MDRLHQMRVYVAVAEAAGFAAAARQLRLSPPAVTRAVAALEESLGARLLERTTRNVRTTEAGRRYLEDARQILASVAAADEAAAGLTSDPRGNLSVTAPVLFGRRFVMPSVVAYLEQYPQTTVQAMLVDRVVNFIDEGMDVAVRIGALPDSSLRALPVGQVRMMVVAAPSYLRRAAVPRTPRELNDHALIASSAGGFSPAWRFAGQGGDQTLRVNPRLMVNTNDAAVGAACEGLGITRLLSYQVADDVAVGRLQVLLEEFEPPTQPVHIVHREGRYASTRVRAFVDLLAERLRSDPAIV